MKEQQRFVEQLLVAIKKIIKKKQKTVDSDAQCK